MPGREALMAAQPTAPAPSTSVQSWEMDRMMHIPLGPCTACPNGQLARKPAYVVGALTWLEAECPECGHVVTLPGGRTRDRARNHDVRPAGVPAWFRAGRERDAR